VIRLVSARIPCFSAIFPNLRDLHTVFEIRSRENPEVLLTDHFRMHFLRLGDMLKRQLEGLSELYGGLQDWMKFFAFADTTPEDKMTQLQPGGDDGV